MYFDSPPKPFAAHNQTVPLVGIIPRRTVTEIVRVNRALLSPDKGIFNAFADQMIRDERAREIKALTQHLTK